MYKTTQDFQTQTLKEFDKLVPGTFILGGAVCDITDSDSISKQPEESKLLGFALSKVAPENEESPDNTGSVSTSDNPNVYFSLLKKYDDSLKEDVHGEIIYKTDHYELTVHNKLKILDFLSHESGCFKLVIDTLPLTIAKLRELISSIRSLYLLSELDESEDVFPVKTELSEIDAIIGKIDDKLNTAVTAGYQYDININSTTGHTNEEILSIRLQKDEIESKTQDVVQITQHTYTFAPMIRLAIAFRNSSDGIFNYITSDDNYELYNVLTPNECNYFINKLIAKLAERKTYKFIKGQDI